MLDQIAADTGNPVERIFVPVSALKGDNIVHRSQRDGLVQGPSLLELLESLPSAADTRGAPFRFPVQRVLRPDHTFRGFAGQIASGTIRPGDAITVLPSGRSAHVERIVTWDGDLDEAVAPLSVTLVLDRELDISRGDLIVRPSRRPRLRKASRRPGVDGSAHRSNSSGRYLLKHTSQTVPAFVCSIDHRTDSGAHWSTSPPQTLHMNDIGAVTLKLLRPIAVDLYSENRAHGRLHPGRSRNQRTVAAGMITAAGVDGSGAPTAGRCLGSSHSRRTRSALGTSRRRAGTQGREGTD